MLASTLALALLGRGGLARGDVDEARKVFAEGVRLYQRGDFEGARRAFKQADAEHHAPAIVYNLGLAEEKLGHVQAAVDAYEAYLAEVGDKADLSSAAAVALAQLKARATRLRIDSRPPGARLFVDGAPVAEPAPATILVGAGRHVVVAQGAGWRAELDVDAKGAGDVLPVTLEPREADAAPPTLLALPDAAADPRPLATTATNDAGVPPPREDDDSGPDLRWGAGFAFAPYYLVGTNNTPPSANAEDARSVVAGPILEGGLGVTRNLALLFRGFVAIGPDAKPTYAFMGGPGLSLRLGSFSFGGSFIGGQLESRANDARYGTDLVFGGMGELSYVVAQKRRGAWLVGIQPAFLLTELRADNTAFLLPVSFGYRSE